jgi:HTH-type transcriptional regulator, sugar sensing transcriptional regulator
MAIDLTSFGFTPTESLVYEVLLRHGPGTGYAIARAAGLARANAYSALEGLVTKGAARVEGGRPRRYRPEGPAGLIARISNNHGLALERLSGELESLPSTSGPTTVEIETGRSVLQLLTQGVTRAERSVELLVPPDAYPLLGPALRRPFAAGIPLSLSSTAPVDLGFATVRAVQERHEWPGMPVIAVFDQQSAIIAGRNGAEVQGHWSSAPSFIAAARLTLQRFAGSP